jgi:hypothetical protein
MELHRWKDIRTKKLSPGELREIDDAVKRELQEMDIESSGRPRKTT